MEEGAERLKESEDQEVSCEPVSVRIGCVNNTRTKAILRTVNCRKGKVSQDPTPSQRPAGND